MKKITLTIAAFIAAISMNAQTVVYSDDFNDEEAADWTFLDEDGDGYNWGDMFFVPDTNGNPVTPVSLISRSWQAEPLTPDNWAISPAITIPADAETATLTWKVTAAAAAWDQEHYTVYVGTSNDVFTLSSASLTFSETYDDPNDEGPTLDRELDVTDMAGETIYVAFRHHNVTDQDFLSIDDVTVTTETSASVADFSALGFEYSMNISTNELSLTATTPIENVKLFNILGQEVLNKKTSATSEVLNLGNLNSGVYIAQVEVNGLTHSFKIVKK